MCVAFNSPENTVSYLVFDSVLLYLVFQMNGYLYNKKICGFYESHTT